MKPSPNSSTSSSSPYFLLTTVYPQLLAGYLSIIHHIAYPYMEHYPNSTHSISLKEDNSRTELLPVVSEVSSLSYFSTKNGHDSAARQWRDRNVAIKDWPETFKTLRKPGWKKAASLTLDILIALIPLVFVGTFHIARRPCPRSQIWSSSYK